MSSAVSTWTMEPPLDHGELCQRVRFSLDDPPAPTEQQLDRRRKHALERREFYRGSMLRVGPRLMPALHRTVEQAARRLMLPSEPEVFIKGDPTLNAQAIPVPGEAPVVVVHSATVNLLTPDELASVIGHEIGHATFAHGYGSRDAESSTGEMFELENSRAAEISADRVGLLAGPSLESTLLAELKMASGLGSAHLQLDVEAVLENFKNRSEEFDRNWEINTHPELTLRFWAEHAFAQTDLFRSLRGESGGRPFAEVEREIEERFLALGGGIAFRAAADVLHESLAWMGVLIVSEDGNVTDQERDTLVRHVGLLWAEDACAYARRQGRKAVERRAKETVRALLHTGARTRNRLMRQIQDLAGSANPAKAEEMLEFVRTALSDA